MTIIKINDSTDVIIEYPIHAGEGMDAFVRLYPTLMTSQRYEDLAKELKNFHEVFWDNSEVAWTDCFETNQEMEDSIVKFFLGCQFIQPNEDVQKLIYRDFPSGGYNE
jgi:hypothetical protein